MSHRHSIGRSASVPLSLVAAAMLLGSGGAAASQLIYKPVNPAFGGNPFNAAYLLGTAEAQNKFRDNGGSGAARAGAGSTTAEIFARNLENRLLSSVAEQVTDAIFGDNPRDSGEVVVGNQRVVFMRGLENIFIQIQDTSTGAMTDIEVPVLK